MRTWLLAVIIVSLLAAMLPAVAAAPSFAPMGGQPFVADEVLVAFTAGVDPVVAARAVGASVHSRLGSLGVYVLKVPPGAVEGTVLALSRNPLVEFAEPNGFMYAIVDPNDPYDNTLCYWASNGQCATQWAWGKLSAYQAWDTVKGSSSVRVAVVDTGIDVGDPAGNPPDTGHPDIVSCGPPVIVRSFVSGETGNDDNGHGTHVAGTIGACTDNGRGVAGANWAVQLMAVKVLNYAGSGTYSAVASGINWAAENGAKVINLSLGGGPSQTVRRAVDRAWNRGAVLACAAGNSGTTARTYPAAYPNCMAVAATDSTDARASFSNYGADWVDVAAPGVGILSTVQDEFVWCFLCWWYGYFPEYDVLSGTSMAAPHVAGLAALVWASGRCTTNSCVRNRIEGKADPIAGTGSLWAKGRINFYRAVAEP